LSSRTDLAALKRIIDANINRAKEGLRVCEDITRFVLDSRILTLEFKKLRHKLDSAIRIIALKTNLLEARFALKDVGKEIYVNELKRKNIRDIFFANIQRCKESIRVLEEFSKLINIESALTFKRVRYKIYDIEKKAAIRMASLHNK
jgi:thiamine-phosphate pyrophosphorylase